MNKTFVTALVSSVYPNEIVSGVLFLLKPTILFSPFNVLKKDIRGFQIRLLLIL